jgi:serine/threonine-protein kinase RsbW
MQQLRMLRPPAPIVELAAWNVTVDADLATIRADVMRVVATVTGDADGERSALVIGLVATELAGNALRHGLPPITVRLLSDHACYVLDVSDHGVDDVPMAVADSQTFSVGGRGLMISAAVAEQVCWYSTPSTKHIWASFPHAGTSAS